MVSFFFVKPKKLSISCLMCTSVLRILCCNLHNMFLCLINVCSVWPRSAPDGPVQQLQQLPHCAPRRHPEVWDRTQQPGEGQGAHRTLVDGKQWCPKCKMSIEPVVSFLQIVIPFFSLLIKDIYFLNEGCASRLSNGHINFEVSAQLKRFVFKWHVQVEVCAFDSPFVLNINIKKMCSLLI